MSAMPQGTHPLTARAQGWRLTTAIRAFGLTFVVGIAMSHHSLRDVALAVLGLAVVAAVTAVGELRSFSGWVRWTPIAEGLAVVALLGSAQFDAALAPYLLVAPVVAGARQGWVPAMNSGLGGVIALVAGVALTAPSEVERVLVVHLPWAVLGLAGGLLAGWQTRARRLLEQRQAPYAAANDLLARLHELVSSHSVELDPAFVAERLCDQLRHAGAVPLAVALTGQSSPSVLLGHVPGEATSSLEACLDTGDTQRFATGSCVPLSLGRHVVAAAVIEAAPDDARLTPVLHDAALRLETALRFREVRWQATADERRRLSREIHDGVAQAIVGLGYLVDEFQNHAISAAALDTALLMRREVDRILDDLRASVHAWRTEHVGASLACSLRSIVDSPEASSGPQAQVSDGGVSSLPPEVHDELLGIAREAIGNVRKHAHADHLWVTLTPTADGARLRVEDDGVGGVAPAPGHHGMHTMRERADRVGAWLVVSARTGGGTVVEVSWPAPPGSVRKGELPDAHAVAGR